MAPDKTSKVHAFVAESAGIDGCAGLDERHRAAKFLSPIQGDGGIDPFVA
jgi:hypothetical protein